MRVGFVGSGNIINMLVPGYRELGVEIAGVFDLNRDAYEKRKDLFGGASFRESLDDLLGDDSIDAVTICVPNKHHAPIIREAMRAGKHVFCEKTLTDSEPESRELVPLVQASGRNFQIGYMKRFFPATIRAKELLPEIGEVFSAYVLSYQGYERTSDPYDDDAWRPREGGESKIRSFTAGGMLNMAGSHMLDLMLFLLGEPVKVYSALCSPPDYDAPTNGHALFTMANGAVAHFDASLSPYSRTGAYRDGWEEKIEINGRKGRLEIYYPVWNKPLNNAPFIRHYSETGKSVNEYTFVKTNPFMDQLAAFVRNCSEGVKSSPGIREGYLVDKLLDACYRSYAMGKEICL